MPQPTLREHIVCGDDEEGILAALRQQLSARFGGECDVAVAKNAREALELIERAFDTLARTGSTYQLPELLRAKGEPAVDRDGRPITCAAIAQRWLATSDLALTGRDLAAKLQAKDGPLDLVMPENIDRIEEHITGVSFESFAASPVLIDAVERCLQRITEAAIKVGAETMRVAAPRLPFEHVRGLGDVLRHAYDVVDPEIVWRTVREDLPTLRKACAAALDG